VHTQLAVRELQAQLAVQKSLSASGGEGAVGEGDSSREKALLEVVRGLETELANSVPMEELEAELQKAAEVRMFPQCSYVPSMFTQRSLNFHSTFPEWRSWRPSCRRRQRSECSLKVRMFPQCSYVHSTFPEFLPVLSTSPIDYYDGGTVRLNMEFYSWNMSFGLVHPRLRYSCLQDVFCVNLVLFLSAS
jgi:hypothetical protein